MSNVSQSTLRTHTLSGDNQPALHLKHWRGTRSQATLLIAPGLGDHCGRYAHVAERLAGEPGMVDVVGFDYRGHGLSEGRRGVVGDYSELVEDLLRAVEWTKTHLPGQPLFLLGHSNGGLVALTAIIDSVLSVDGLILSSPALQLKDVAPAWKLAVGRLLRRFAPWVTLPGPLPAEYLTRDPEMAAQRRADALVHSRLSPPLFFGMMEAAKRVLSLPGRIQVPCLTIVGMSDPVIDPTVTLRYFDQLGSPDRELIEIEAGVHEPLHDINWPNTLDHIALWLHARLARVGRVVPRGSDCTREIAT